jgi:hypothetical protein
MHAERTSLRGRKVHDGIDEAKQPACVALHDAQVRELPQCEVASLDQLCDRPKDLARVRL